LWDSSDSAFTDTPDARSSVDGARVETPFLDSSRTRASLINGGLLLLLLFGFRLETAFVLRLDLGLSDWMLSFLPDVAAVVFVELLLVLVAASTPHRAADAAWRFAFAPVHVLLYVIALVEQQFFLHTGTHVDLDLIAYTFANLGNLHSLLGTGMDLGLIPRAAAAGLCFGLGWSQVRSANAEPFTLSPALAGLTLIGSLGIVAATPEPDGPAASLSNGVFADFFEFGAGRTGAERSTWLDVHIESIYEPPSLDSRGAARRPDVVLLVLESMRADIIGPHARPGEPKLTPFLDRFAREALVYETVYTTVPHTSKALIGILCGMYPMLVMSIVESVPGQLPVVCAPQLLREIGYRTAFMQTALGEFENRPGLAENLGFEKWIVQEDLAGDYEQTGYFGMDEFAMLEPALAWLAEKKSQPSFLTLLTVSTHHPYQTPGMPAPGYDEAFDGYRRAVQHVDRFAQAIYEGMKSTGALENTVFIIVGDHGEAFGEHTRRQHDVVPYEEGIRVPLLIRGPEWLGPPRRISGLRSHIDLLPTLLELLDVRWSGLLPGLSLLSSDGHESVLASCWYDDHCLAFRKGDLKYVFHYERKPSEVFDLSTDPHELRNLADDMPQAMRDAVERKMLTYRFSIDANYRANAPKPSRPSEQTPN
jgi:arylsulfatase A-like enzyme